MTDTTTVEAPTHQSPSSPPVLSLGDQVNVTNNSERKLDLMFNNRSYKVGSGDTAMIPFEAAILWFGDPRSTGLMASAVDERGVPMWIPDRETEVRRIKIKWGDTMGPQDEFQNVPDVTIKTLDGTAVPFVVHDPTGETTAPVNLTIAQQRSKDEEVTQMRRELNDMREMLNQLLSGKVSDSEVAARLATEPNDALSGEEGVPPSDDHVA